MNIKRKRKVVEIVVKVLDLNIIFNGNNMLIKNVYRMI